ncbi:hypothetical protein [Vibrio cyclitrophicus]|uniref:hypothetical protein n=1 Tax=Vibrio cyclitrophicus TaxID=47951 RepID=UPI0020A4A4B0|nr:hypothetical protein [Vibrio cyclitrophicus]
MRLNKEYQELQQGDDLKSLIWQRFGGGNKAARQKGLREYRDHLKKESQELLAQFPILLQSAVGCSFCMLAVRKSLSRGNSLCLDKSAEGASADVYGADVLLTAAPLLVK